MNKTKWISRAALWVVLIVGLVGCAGGNPETSTEGTSTDVSSQPVADVSANGKEDLVVAMSYDPTSLDPVDVNEVAAANAMKNIFENLLILDENGAPQPQLALSWEVEGNQHYTFHLRDNVYFSNGEKMTSADVQFSLERAMSAPSVSQYFDRIDPASFETPDELTISFSLLEPNSVFLSYLAHSGAMITSKKAVEEEGDNFASHPVGTGPYVLDSWAKNDRLVFKRNENYWNTPANFKTLTMRTITEQPNRAIELETGNVDIAYELAATDLDRIAQNDQLILQKETISSLTFLGFNQKSAPFAELKVRQAIQAALPMEDMIQATFQGLAAPTDGFVPPNIKYSDSKSEVAPQDIEKAKQLLADAGYPDGFSANIIVNENPARVKIATIMKEELAKVGIDLTIEQLEWGAFLDELERETGYDMFILSWSSTVPDPDTCLYSILHSSASSDGSNYTHFENKEFDALLDKGRLLEDGEEREAVYLEAQKILREELPSLPLCNTVFADGQQAYVEGFEISPNSVNELYPVSFR